MKVEINKMASFKESQMIENLNSMNYSNQRFKIEIMLIKQDLLKALAENPPNPVTKDWLKKYKKARVRINLSIEDKQIIHIKHLNTARET